MTEKGNEAVPVESSSDDVGMFTMPGIDFSTFVFSLNSSALVHLGMLSAPDANGKVVDLPLAKQTIDILGLLDVKTAGNLTSDEQNLLKNTLHDLRLMYVRLKEQGA